MDVEMYYKDIHFTMFTADSVTIKNTGNSVTIRSIVRDESNEIKMTDASTIVGKVGKL
jgi:hypothetical protein